MRIAITNTVALNTGDAAILLATIDILRSGYDGSPQFIVFDSQAGVAARYYPEIRFRESLHNQIAASYRTRARRRVGAMLLLCRALATRFRPRLGRMVTLDDGLVESLDLYAGADAVVSAGGTYLRAGYRMGPKLLDFAVTLALGRPLVLFTQSIGQVGQNWEGLVLRFVLKRCSLILVRDALSRENLRRMGIPDARIADAADSAFALARRRRSAPRRPRDGRRLSVAISVRDWPHFESRPGQVGMACYLDAVAGLVRHLVAELSANVVFVSTCQGVPEYWTDDSLVAEQVLDRLPASLRSTVSIDRQFHRPEQLLRCLAEHDIVIATRLHVAILALCAGIPVVPIAYEFKTRELFQRLDPAYPLQDIESVDAEGLVQAFRSVHARLGELGRIVETWVSDEGERAMTAGRIVANTVPMRP